MTAPATKMSYVSLLKLTGLNLLAFGLELCACAGFTYIPPILLKNGFSDKNLTIVMGIGPFISLLLVPYIGHWSDRCQSRFGRRRPFMFVLGLMMIISLLVIPFSNEIFDWCKNTFHPSFGLAAGVIILDFSSQALMNPCKSLIPDIFHSIEEQNSGFTVYSCMLSLGGCVGYFITSVNWRGSSFGILFGGQEKAVFSLLAIILFLLLSINLSIAKEEPLTKNVPLMSALNMDKYCNGIFNNVSLEHKVDSPVHFSYIFSKGSDVFKNRSVHNSQAEGRSYALFHFMKTKSLKLLKYGMKRILSLILFPLSIFINFSLKEFFQMSPVLFRLFIACLFGWMGIMCHDMYYSDFVGQVIYRGKPLAERESIAVNLYDEGVRMGSWGLLFHCLCAALYAAFFQENLVYYFGKHKVYMFGMFSFSLSLLGTVLTNSLILVNTFAALSGLGLAAITTIPYSWMTEYYKTREAHYYDGNFRGVGEDMAVLDSAFYLSQIIPSLFLGSIVEYTKSSSIYMIVAASCGTAACYFSYFITFTPHSTNIC